MACWVGVGGSSPDILTISTLVQSCLKAGVGCVGVVVAHKIIASAPVLWIGDLGLGLDNKMTL